MDDKKYVIVTLYQTSPKSDPIVNVYGLYDTRYEAAKAADGMRGDISSEHNSKLAIFIRHFIDEKNLNESLKELGHGTV